MKNLKEEVSLYIRTNNNYELDKATVLDIQKTQLELYCKEKNYDIKDVYYDIGHYKSKNRLSYNKMVNDIKKGKIKKIVIFSIDRISRDVSDIEKFLKILEKYNCVAEFINENTTSSNSYGRTKMIILSILKEYESEVLKNERRTRKRSTLHKGKHSRTSKRRV